MMNGNCFLTSIGTYIPNQKISCDKIAENFGVTEKIYDRGVFKPVTEKSIIEIATTASKEAIRNAKLNPKELELIIGSTTGPGLDIGLSFAAGVQNSLSAVNSECIDVGVRCIGAIQAIDIARSKFLLNLKKNALIVVASKSSDTLSELSICSNPSCIFFGDGAAAILLTRTPVTKRRIAFGHSKVLTHGEFWNASYYKNFSVESNKAYCRLFFNSNMLGSKFKQVDKKETLNLLSSISKNMGISLEELDGLIVLNRSNNYRQRLSEITKIPLSSIFTSQDQIGHIGPVDLFINLKNFIDRKERFRSAILFATSFGYYWGASPLYEF